MPNTIHVARSEADWHQALALLRAVYVGQGYSADTWADTTLQRTVLEPEGQGLIVVGENEEVLGFTLLLHPESTMRQLAGPGEREFRLLAVSTAARGQGVGQALVHACIERSIADGAQALVLWTQPTMLAAQRLYERLGFVRATERDHADPRGFMRMVYRLVLN